MFIFVAIRPSRGNPLRRPAFKSLSAISLLRRPLLTSSTICRCGFAIAKPCPVSSSLTGEGASGRSLQWAHDRRIQNTAVASAVFGGVEAFIGPLHDFGDVAVGSE